MRTFATQPKALTLYKQNVGANLLMYPHAQGDVKVIASDQGDVREIASDQFKSVVKRTGLDQADSQAIHLIQHAIDKGVKRFLNEVFDFSGLPKD